MGNNGSERRNVIKIDKYKTGESRRMVNIAIDFASDYRARHAHPVNAALHLVGVPAAFYGFYNLFSGKNIAKGSVFVLLGYLLQYLGHRAQGNEVGEVTLIKSIYRKIKN